MSAWDTEKVTLDGKEYTIELYPDEDPISPMEGEEDVSIAYLKRSRYTLGTEGVDEETLREIGERIESGELIGLPVYAYIHSGVALSTGAFSCPWDSGQSGFVYIHRSVTLKWYGGKRITKKKISRALDSLRSIVDTFGKYLNGECYGYVIKDADGEVLDSCWGFYDDHGRTEAREQVKYWHSKALAEDAEARYWLDRGVVTVAHST